MPQVQVMPLLSFLLLGLQKMLVCNMLPPSPCHVCVSSCCLKYQEVCWINKVIPYLADEQHENSLQ